MTNLLNIEGFTGIIYYNILFIYFLSLIFCVITMSSLLKIDIERGEEIKRIRTISEIEIISFILFISMIIFHQCNIDFYLNKSLYFFYIFIVAFFVFCFLLLKYAEKKESFRFFEIPLFLLFFFSSSIFIFISNNLFFIFFLIEIISFVSYSYVGYIKNFFQTEGGLKYFIMGSLASSLLIFGLSFIYFIYGTLNIDELMLLLTLPQKEEITFLLIFSMVLIFSSLFIKMGVAPFHLWLPEVYSSVPSIITLYLLILPKISFLYITWIFFSFSSFSNLFFPIFLVFVLISFLTGASLAFYQTSLKKFISYSSIFNNGFFIGVLLLNSNFSFFSLIFFKLTYVLIIFLFFIPILFSLDLNKKEFLNNFRDFIFLKKNNIILSLALTFSLFSFAGIPPFIGFFSKYFLLVSSLEEEKYFLIFLFLSFSLGAAFYYLRAIKTMFFPFELPFQQILSYSPSLAYLLIFFLLINIIPFIFPKIISLIFFL